MSFELEVIATVESPFKEKFGIPRQPRLVNAACSKIVLKDKFNHPDYVAELTQHSHIWLLFLFHQNLSQGYKSQVRPPRMGGNKKIGVFATRSTYRPNGIGMSAVKLLGIENESGQINLLVEAADLLDQTPIVDIKPYIPYSDSILTATSEFAQHQPDASMSIDFSDSARQSIAQLPATEYPKLQELIVQVLQQDPRPAYKKNKLDEKQYGIRLYDLNIKWQVTAQQCLVLAVEQESIPDA